MPTGRALILVLAFLAGCEGHGSYTSAFLDDVEADRARLRAATEYDQAVQRFQSGDLDQALAMIDRAIALDGDTAMASLLRGRILLELGASEAAVASFDRGAALDPDDPEYFYYRGIAYERLGDLERALAEYDAAASLDPTETQFVLASAEVLTELDRFDEARQVLERRTGDIGAAPGIHQALGHLAMLEGDHEEAVRHLLNATILDPESRTLREDLAQAQIAAQRFDDAEATLRRLLEVTPDGERRELMRLRASCLLELDRVVEARGILFRLIRTPDGGDLDAWIKMIDVALRLDDDSLLRTVGNHLVAVAPGRYEGHLAQAVWQQRNGDLDAALRSADRAIRCAGDDPAPRRYRIVLEDQRAHASG